MPEVCEIASQRYRYLEGFFTGQPDLYPPAASGVFMSDLEAPPAEKERKIDQALEKLEEGIKHIFESDNYREYLRTLGKFHDYSLGNLILIWLQNKDATRVAGFNTWKDLGRFVKKGEKGLMILAPCFPPKGKAEPKPEKEEEEEEKRLEPRPIYFRVVYVFDISQTEGDPLPEVEVPVVQGEDSGPLFDLGLQYAEKLGIKILDQPKAQVSPDTMGYYAPQPREIWVRKNVPKNQQTKSLFHEVAHSAASDKYGPGAEVIAESVAFAVCNHFGFDTGERSFPYVALWAQDIKVLKQRLDQIRAVTKEIIDGITVLAELRDCRLEDFGSAVVSGLGIGIGLKTVDYLVRRAMARNDKSCKDESCKDAALLDYITEGLVCKICGRPVPPKAIPEVWAGYHIKYDHRDYVKTLAADRLPWVAGLTVAGEAYPLRKTALEKLKPYKILEVHEDGGLTVKSQGKEWIVSPEGKAYVNHKLRDSATLGMMLLTQEIRKRLPPLRATEHQDDPIVQVKFFTPWTYWTWYATEFDGEDEFFGLVRGHEIEMGYFSLKELEAVRGPAGLRIERDRYFEPTPLSKVRAQLEAGKMADKIENLEDLTPTEKSRMQLLKTALQHIGKASSTMAKASEFSFYVDEKIADLLRKAWGTTMQASNEIGDVVTALARKDLGFARAEDHDGKLALIQQILNLEVCLNLTSMDSKALFYAARDFAKKTVAELNAHLKTLRNPQYVLQKNIEAATYKGLGREVPAWLKEIDDPEEFADEYVLPELKMYPGDKLSLDDIRELVKKSRISGKPPAFTDEDLEEALDYLEGAGEVITREATAEKPKLWIPTPMGDPAAVLGSSNEVPKLIEVWKTTIVKHYRPKAAFHKTSFRVLKPNKDTLIWLGCLKTDEWKGKACSENQTLHKTIVKKTDRGIREVRKLASKGIEVKYYAEEGIVPRAEDDILGEIAQAMNKAQEVK